MTGILCIDKPQGFTSFDVVAKIRGMARTKKVGHGGTLDPMATGVLPLFLGGATRACDLVPAQDKRYIATLRLGITTDTLDITGTVTQERPVTATAADLQLLLPHYVGEQDQLPPMYSAVQVNGVRLYDLARKGQEVERKPRRVHIHSIDLLEHSEAAGEYTLDVHCSKGTYIRSLCHDIGQALGCGATLAALRRTLAGGFALQDCITLEEAQRLCNTGHLQDRLLPVEAVFASLPRLVLDQRQTRLLQNGVRLDADALHLAEDGRTLIAFGPGETFLGLVQVREGKLRVVKLFLREAMH